MPIQWLASINCQYRDIWYLRCAYICVLVCILCLSYVLRPMLSALVVVLFYLRLNVAICIVCLHFSSFCCLSSVGEFANTGARAPTSAGHAPFSPARRAMWFECGSWLSFDGCFILFYRSHSYRWAAVVSRSNKRSWALSRKTHVQDQFRYRVWPSMGLFKYLYVHHAASHVYVKKTKNKRL